MTDIEQRIARLEQVVRQLLHDLLVAKQQAGTNGQSLTIIRNAAGS